MPSKQKTRRRPDIQNTQLDRKKRDEHQICIQKGCKNVVAIWTNRNICVRCMADTR